MTLSAEQVQAVNMIVHELVSNALKYGALSSLAGQVEVEWRADTERAIALAWRERGGPTIASPAKIGFGTRLIQRLAAQLRGCAAAGARLSATHDGPPAFQNQTPIQRGRRGAAGRRPRR